ncbi:MAG: tetratricopeptide repeat protein [Melioribacteraceae bacterium]|nr:tetratricopeptide repeat protein [Melioribacteraceae bacterium]
MTAKKAHDLDPLSLSILNTLAHVYFTSGNYKESEKTFLKVLDLDKNYSLTVHSLGWLYLHIKEYDKAEKLFLDFIKNENNDFKIATSLSYLYAKMGNMNKAEKYLNIIIDQDKKHDMVSFSLDLAVVYIAFKDFDKVFYYLDKAYEERIGSLIFMQQDHWGELKGDPRYLDLLKRMDFID